jgi:hypothetical protein
MTMNEIAKRQATDVSTDLASRLYAGIAESRATTVLMGGGKPMLRMLKSGEWVFGQENNDVQEGSSWAINVATLAHGWSCWVQGEGNSKNTLAGEIMASMLDAKPPCPPPIDGFPYKEQRSFDLKCMDGEDSGTEVVHKITSDGGLKASHSLLGDIQKQIKADPSHYYPIVTLGQDHYMHPKWGKTYTPIYRIVGWCDGEGNLAGGAEPQLPLPTPAAAAPQPPRKRPLTPSAPAAAPAPAQVAPAAPQEAAFAGQRRRPIAR